MCEGIIPRVGQISISITLVQDQCFFSSLFSYVQECMVSIININSGIKEHVYSWLLKLLYTWYLVSTSKWKDLYISELLFRSIPSYTILILGHLYLCMKILAWHIDPNGYVENKNTMRCPFSSCMYLKKIVKSSLYILYKSKKRYKTNIGLPLGRWWM